MAKGKKKRKHPGSLMGRSDIPYARRMAMQHRRNIVNNRDRAAKIAMYCNSVAMHELEGIGYKRLVHFSHRFKTVVDEFYQDSVEVGMERAKRRMEQMGMPISGEFYRIKLEGATTKQQEIHDNKLQAVQVALVCAAIAMNDEFGFGKDRQERISIRANELSARYAAEGEGFLLKEMEKLGFAIVDGEAIAFMDDDGNAITYKQWKEGANE